MSKYIPAVFQPTVRPAWVGILSYVSNEEKAQILEAILKYPQETDIKSKFWEETIKPDLETQYTKFKKSCEAKGCGSRTYWESKDKDMDKISLPDDNHMNNISIRTDKVLKDKDKDKDKVNNRGNYKGGEEKLQPAIDLWVAYKKERGQTYKARGYEAMVNNLRELSGDDLGIAKQIVQQSMANNWSGLFRLKEEPRPAEPKTETIDDIIERMKREEQNEQAV